MPRKFLRRVLPRPHRFHEDRNLRVFGRLLHNPDLWHLNRSSVARACAVGLFMAFVPVPFQMVLAAGAAIVLSCNLPISVALVWITNPVTMPAIFYATYKLGAWLLGMHPEPFDFELSTHWLMHRLGEIWEPFLLGCFLTAVVSAALGYWAVQLTWRMHVVSSWRERKARRAERRQG